MVTVVSEETQLSGKLILLKEFTEEKRLLETSWT